MALITRPSFAKGWCPDCDAVKAPPDALLRMDNCVLDELGAVSLRKGSDVLYTLADLDVHSLYTAVLSGTRYRFAGAGNTVYLNGSSLSTSVAGSGDISFASMMGQVFFTRSTTHKKYDGTTLRNWGIAMTGGTPTVASLAADTKTFATGNSTESPAFVYSEDDGTGAAFTTGYDGTANGAIRLHLSTTTGRGLIRKTYASDQDWSKYDSAASVSDDAFITVWCYIDDAAKFNTSPFGVIQITVWVNSSLIGLNDYYDYRWTGPFTTGWQKLVVRRGDMTYSSGTGATWATARAVDLFAQYYATGTAVEVRFDTVQVSSGNLDSGEVTWKYRLAYNNGTYTSLSPMSVATVASAFTVSGATITVPADTSRDSQFNEVWLYRNEPALGEDYYRVKVKTGVSGTGAITIDDTLSAADALTVNITDDGGTTPPDTIIGIAGPHFDRLWVLTATTLYLSKVLNPDTFSNSQAITVGGSDEVAYWIVKAPGGLYLGTSKDIYRLNGTAAELPDGTIDVTKENLNVDHPPISSAFAAEGPTLIYFASDGWRTLDGYQTRSLTGVTSLLYQGYARHGVSAVNVTAGRFRAVLAKDQLVAITPEGADTSSSDTLYRYKFSTTQWYRHPYVALWRSLFREPDGTLLAGDTTGHIWTLDSNTTSADNSAAIDVTLWTKADELDDPFRQKVANDLHLEIKTGSVDMDAAVHLDQSETAALVCADVNTATLEHTVRNLLALSTAQQMQLRLTGTVNTFRLGAVGWSYKAIPLGVLAWDSGPIDAGVQEMLWIRAVRVQVIGSAALTMTVYADGIAQGTATVTPVSATAASPVTAWFGRGVKGRSLRVTIESTEMFTPYWIDLVRRATGGLSENGLIRVKAETAA